MIGTKPKVNWEPHSLEIDTARYSLLFDNARVPSSLILNSSAPWTWKLKLGSPLLLGLFLASISSYCFLHNSTISEKCPSLRVAKSSLASKLLPPELSPSVFSSFLSLSLSPSLLLFSFLSFSFLSSSFFSSSFSFSSFLSSSFPPKPLFASKLTAHTNASSSLSYCQESPILLPLVSENSNEAPFINSNGELSIVIEVLSESSILTSW